jgi:hypothetical protein
MPEREAMDLLYQRYLDNALSTEEMEQLDRAIQDDPEVARQIARTARLESLVRRSAAESAATPAQLPMANVYTLRRWVSVAAVVLVTLIAWLLFSRGAVDPTDPELQAFVIGGPGRFLVFDSIPEPDGGAISVGSVEQSGPFAFDLLVVRTDRDGEIDWYRALDSGERDYGHSLVRRANGGFVVLGQVREIQSKNADNLVAAFTAAGELEWSTRFGDSLFDAAYSIAVSPDGRIYVASISRTLAQKNLVNEGLAFDRPFESGGYTLTVVTCLDAYGQILWQKAVDASATEGNVFLEVHPTLTATRDGGVLLVAATDRDVDAGQGLLVRMNRDGAIDWQRRYACGTRGILRSAVERADGGFTAVGFSRNDQGVEQGWILSVDAAGEPLRQVTCTGNDWSALVSVVRKADGTVIAGGATGTMGDLKKPETKRRDRIRLIEISPDGGVPGGVDLVMGTTSDAKLRGLHVTAGGGLLACGRGILGDDGLSGWVLPIADLEGDSPIRMVSTTPRATETGFPIQSVGHAQRDVILNSQSIEIHTSQIVVSPR